LLAGLGRCGGNRAGRYAEGLKLAERSLALVEELGLGDKAIGSSLWLVGALEMAAGRLSTAIAQFRRAEEAFEAAQLAEPAAMARIASPGDGVIGDDSSWAAGHGVAGGAVLRRSIDG